MHLTEYETDYYSWLMKKAGLLREKGLDEIDTANIAEKLEAMGRSEKRIGPSYEYIDRPSNFYDKCFQKFIISRRLIKKRTRRRIYGMELKIVVPDIFHFSIHQCVPWGFRRKF